MTKMSDFAQVKIRNKWMLLVPIIDTSMRASRCNDCFFQSKTYEDTSGECRIPMECEESFKPTCDNINPHDYGIYIRKDRETFEKYIAARLTARLNKRPTNEY